MLSSLSRARAHTLTHSNSFHHRTDDWMKSEFVQNLKKKPIPILALWLLLSIVAFRPFSFSFLFVSIALLCTALITRRATDFCVCPILPHYSSIVKMTPVLSSTILWTRRESNIFICRARLHRQKYATKSRVCSAPRSRFYGYSHRTLGAHWQYFDFYVHLIRWDFDVPSPQTKPVHSSIEFQFSRKCHTFLMKIVHFTAVAAADRSNCILFFYILWDL